MLINNWLIVDDLNNNLYKDWKDGFCLDLHDEMGYTSSLYRDLQKQTFGNSFTILLSGKNFSAQNANDRFIEKIVTLFFQPSYYLVNYRPLVFLDNNDDFGFIERVTEKCKKQALDLLLIEPKDARHVESPINSYAYHVTTPGINHNLIIDTWLNQYLENSDPGEIHFLFSKKENGFSEVLNDALESQMALHQTEHYKFADIVYQKQKLIDEYKHELDLKIASENDLRSYLTVQKKHTADNVEWYQHEYEILPLLYKRFGHIIKVLMGKRSFRSLFNDHAKKYKN